MVFLIGSVRVRVIAILFILTAIPESASSELTITVEHKKERKNDAAVAELSKTDQPKSPESKDEGPTTLESKNGEPTTPESTEGTAKTTAEGAQEATTIGTEEITSDDGPDTTQGPIQLTTICYKCAFGAFGKKPPTTTPVPKIPTQEPATELPTTITPVPKIPTQEPPTVPTQEAVTELQTTITPVPKIPTQEPEPVPTQEPATVPTQEPKPVPTQEPATVPTQEAVTELPPTMTPVPEIPTQEAVTEVTEPSIPTTESPFPPKGPVTEEDECSTFGKENKEPPEHCFKRTPRPPPTMKPPPPPQASEKPDFGLTVPPVVSPKGYSGGEITPPPTHCPPNEVYKECDFLCQPSCKRLVRPKKCPYICIPRCLCKKPLVRRESDGKCVHRSMCPKCKKPKRKLPRCPKCKKPKKNSDGYPYDRNIFKPPTDNRRPPTDHRPPIYPPIDQEPPTDQRPPIDQEPPTDQRPPIDQEPPTDQRPPRYPPIDQEPPTDQRPPRYPPIDQEPPTDHRPPRYPPIDQEPPTDHRPPRYPPIDQEPPTDHRPPRYPPIDQEPPNGQFGLSIDYEGPSIEEFYHKRPPTRTGWKKCPPQEVFSMCAGACQATCRRPRRKCARGCICRKPFVRREADGKCVPRSKCHCKKRKHCKKGIMGRQSKELWDKH